ncbi:tubulin binding cofactor A [Coniella lustricola]|uniref:Tubulin-specific chaperone A n=1 Tax=Coniella lustricola TaxID=2025994 RepID=A0A2T3AIU0_9PEZI|nr:tubulin binding cofactor A [Coniella lustricola]
MPAPSPLAIATSSVQRLVKEEAYYHKDLASQEVRVQKLEKDISEGGADLDENAEYMLKQEKKALQETKSVFGPLRSRIADAVAKLEEQIALSESEDAPAEQLTKAKEALKQGQGAVQTTSS